MLLLFLLSFPLFLGYYILVLGVLLAGDGWDLVINWSLVSFLLDDNIVEGFGLVFLFWPGWWDAF